MIISEKKNEWSKLVLNENDLIIKAIQNLNFYKQKIILVVSKNKKLVGTITDGDIRRGFIKGMNTKNKLKQVKNTKYSFVSMKVSLDQAKQIMLANDIMNLPIVDKKKNIKGLYSFVASLPNYNENIPFVIMAGGKGSRLKPITNNCPKPLIKINKKPILEHIIIKARNEGFKNFFITLNYLGHKIEKYFSDGKKWNVKIRYVRENSPLGTAGSLNLVKKYLKTNFIVVNGDILSSVNFSDLLDFHLKNKAAATMTVKTHEIQHPYGIVNTKGMEIKNLQEKPIIKDYVHIGVYAFHPLSLKLLKKKGYFDMPNVFDWLRKKKKKIIIFPLHETWVDLGIKNELKKIQKNFEF